MRPGCGVCGKKLSLRERIGENICDSCEGERSAAIGAARGDYSQILEAVIRGQLEVVEGVRRLDKLVADAALTPEAITDLRARGITGYMDEALSDAVLNDEEEHHLATLMAELDVPWVTLAKHSPDAWPRLLIATINGGRLPTITDPPVMLKAGEVAHQTEQATLLKEVAIREYRGSYGGFSFRVAKGVRYSTGGTRGRSVVVGTELQALDQGYLTVTSKRIVFPGTKKTIALQLAKLVNLDVYTDGIRIHVENRQNAPLFRVENGDVTAAVINAAYGRL